MDSFWSRVKLEQSNLACLHLLYREKQVQSAGATLTRVAKKLPGTLRGMLIIFLTGMLKLSLPPCKSENELHVNHPQESGAPPPTKSDHNQVNLISDQLQQSPCSICTATQPRGQHSNPPQSEARIQWQMGFPNLYVGFRRLLPCDTYSAALNRGVVEGFLMLTMQI